MSGSSQDSDASSALTELNNIGRGDGIQASSSALSAGLKSTAGSLVHDIDLIMEEIYVHVGEKRDLITCMVASKRDFKRAAKVLYRHIKSDTMGRMIAKGCNLVSSILSPLPSCFQSLTHALYHL